MVQKLELLAPAGSLAALKAVICAGADAVYFGGGAFGARAYAENFKKEEVLEAIDYGHIHEKKLFLTVNTLLKERELEEELYEYLLPYYTRGLDAVIVQDFGVMRFLQRNFPDLSIHTSTQMTVTGAEGAGFLAGAGAKRIVLARELSLEEIRTIHQSTAAELECFVHGALCYCYSGQCLFSSMLGGRSGNRGRCAQPCRLPYEICGSQWEQQKGRRKNYPLSLKDLCAVSMIPQLAECGVTSLKIEGRMKQAEYAAGVVSVYRAYLDRYERYGAKDYAVDENDRKKLLDLGNRSGFTEGYLTKRNGPDMVTFDSPAHEKRTAGKERLPEEIKEKITGSLKIKKGMPSELTVSFHGIQATVCSDTPVRADRQPLTKESLRLRLYKTGNTPFVFERLDILLEPGLFLPAASLNELRRRALEALQEQVIRGYFRTDKQGVQKTKASQNRQPAAIARQHVTASAETIEQAQVLLGTPWISRIYLDSAVFAHTELVHALAKMYRQANDAGKELFYILPAVFRNHTAVFYRSVLPKLETDGFLVKSYDALGFLLKEKIAPKQIRIDHNLYTWSAESKAAFRALGVEGDTVPFELNRAEIKRRDNTDSEMVIYGYQPLMTSAQCVFKNSGTCRKTPQACWLKDRYGICFPVKNYCQECYTVIYNSRPLWMFPFTGELKSYGIGAFRFSFTIESGEQTAQVLQDFERQAPFDRERFTYGHYKRGVE